MKKTAAAIIALALAATAAHAGGDAAKGAKVFKKCKACHKVDKKKNGVGPYLVGVIGRPIATADKYKYSPAMKAFGAAGGVWDEAALTTYLADPKGTVPKTKMTFKGLKKDDDIENVIAYLATFP
ncbi:MAG: c-type cytochrome [Paracoccaceae bacterium]